MSNIGSTPCLKSLPIGCLLTKKGDNSILQIEEISQISIGLYKVYGIKDEYKTKEQLINDRKAQKAGSIKMKKPGAGAKRVLVVEDEPAICDLCRRVLAGEGFEVDIAANGKVAQGMVEEKQYALCLIDIKMPIMNGKALYLWLKEKHPQLAGRVIFTTGSVMGGDTRSFLEQTDRPFLPKPFTPDELKAIVKQSLRQLEK